MSVIWSPLRKATAIGAIVAASLTLGCAVAKAARAAPMSGPVVLRMANGYATAAVESDPSVLNGVYRIAWTEKELVAAGASPRYAHENLGPAHGNPLVITMTLRDGHMLQHWSIPPDCLGSYAVSGAAVLIREQLHCHGVVTAKWSLGNGLLRLHITRATDAGDKTLFGAMPWKKIG